MYDMTTLAIYKLWSFLQSLPLTASNERWLAERLLESANAKSVSKRLRVYTLHNSKKAVTAD